MWLIDAQATALLREPSIVYPNSQHHYIECYGSDIDAQKLSVKVQLGTGSGKTHKQEVFSTIMDHIKLPWKYGLLTLVETDDNGDIKIEDENFVPVLHSDTQKPITSEDFKQWILREGGDEVETDAASMNTDSWTKKYPTWKDSSGTIHTSNFWKDADNYDNTMKHPTRSFYISLHPFVTAKHVGVQKEFTFHITDTSAFVNEAPSTALDNTVTMYADPYVGNFDEKLQFMAEQYAAYINNGVEVVFDMAHLPQEYGFDMMSFHVVTTIHVGMFFATSLGTHIDVKVDTDHLLSELTTSHLPFGNDHLYGNTTIHSHSAGKHPCSGIVGTTNGPTSTRIHEDARSVHAEVSQFVGDLSTAFYTSVLKNYSDHDQHHFTEKSRQHSKMVDDLVQKTIKATNNMNQDNNRTYHHTDAWLDTAEILHEVRSVLTDLEVTGHVSTDILNAYEARYKHIKEDVDRVTERLHEDGILRKDGYAGSSNRPYNENHDDVNLESTGVELNGTAIAIITTICTIILVIFIYIVHLFRGGKPVTNVI